MKALLNTKPTKFGEVSNYILCLMCKNTYVPIKSVSLLAIISIMFWIILGFPQTGMIFQVFYVGFLLIMGFSYILTEKMLTKTLLVMVYPAVFKTEIQKTKAWGKLLGFLIFVIFSITPILAVIDLVQRIFYSIVHSDYHFISNVLFVGLFQVMLLVSLASYLSKLTLHVELSNSLNSIVEVLAKLDNIPYERIMKEYDKFMESIKYTKF